MGKVAKANRRTGLTGHRKGLATKQGFAALGQIFGKFGRGGGDGVKSQGGSPNVWGVFFISRPRAYLKGGIWHFYLPMVIICRIIPIMSHIIDHATQLSHCIY